MTPTLWRSITGQYRAYLRGERDGLAHWRKREARSITVDLDNEEPGGGTAHQRHIRFTAALVRLHRHVYGTWPTGAQVSAVLDALDIPRENT